MIYQPLKTPWAIDEDSSVSVVEQIQDRTNSEDNYAWAKGFPLIKQEDITKK